MSYLLEILGRGLVSSLRSALRSKLPDVDELNLTDLNRRRAEHPQDHQSTLLLGMKLLWQADYLGAGRCFDEVLSRDDESVAALLALASVHDEMGRTEQALNLLNQARLLDILDPVILFCVGFCVAS